MKKIILTSALAIMIVMPAMATSYTAGESASCNNSVLGAYTGPVNATANFTINSYTCSAGTYLPADGIECEQCPANSYCGGDTYQYNQSTAQGATACPSGYTSSDAGASTQGQCYRTCTTADVAHSTSVSGKFYQDQTNACEPANENACVNGYHYTAGFNPSTSLPGTQQGSSCHAKANDGTFYFDSGNSYNASNMTSEQIATYNDVPNNGDWRVNWSSGTNPGTMHGIAQCSSQGGTDFSGASSASDISTRATLPDSTGVYCWCKATSWTPSGGSEQSLSAPWSLNSELDTVASCATRCANRCARSLYFTDQNYLVFRSNVFSATSSPAQCSANEITINWGGYGANNDQNETNTCTYDGTLTAPETAPTKRGHNFTGWTFGQQ